MHQVTGLAEVMLATPSRHWPPNTAFLAVPMVGPGSALGCNDTKTLIRRRERYPCRRPDQVSGALFNIDINDCPCANEGNVCLQPHESKALKETNPRVPVSCSAVFVWKTGRSGAIPEGP